MKTYRLLENLGVGDRVLADDLPDRLPVEFPLRLHAMPGSVRV